MTPSPDRECILCGKQHYYNWGIAHGDGNCSDCGYPCTVYHFVEGNKIEKTLQYHPDYINVKEDVDIEENNIEE